MNGEDYHYAPKPKHLRPAQLLRVLGSSFDPFWMSIERPADAGAWTSKDGSVDTETLGDPNAPVPNANDNGFNFSASPELTEGATRYRRKLEKDANDLHFPELPAEVASAVRDWLVRSATCALHYRWVHLAPVFWPRWMRHTDCEQSRESRSCSFPSGMTCQRAQTTQIKMLAWHCWGNEEVGAVQRRTAVVGNGGKRCLWRQVPYPVLTNLTLLRKINDIGEEIPECQKDYSSVQWRPHWAVRNFTEVLPSPILDLCCLGEKVLGRVRLLKPFLAEINTVVPIGDQLSSSDREAIQYYMELLSVRAWRYTMVLFVSEAEVKCTYNDKNLVVERAQSILVKCGGRHHHFECGSSTNQVSALLGKIDLLKAENEDEFFIPEVYYALLESKIPREMTEVIRVYEDREVSLKQRHTREMQEIKEQLRKYREAADSGRLGWTGSYELLPPNMNTETENRTGIQKEETVRKIHLYTESEARTGIQKGETDQQIVDLQVVKERNRQAIITTRLLGFNRVWLLGQFR
ncbi:hypothetical protein DPEC_G00173150 [Dallia pectoralis]|uniref:Uncharacterized protein n=1 Tax=Dallia pectoralis TaxID=75939 RepID=A0ACC2GDV6_DALPE|nr:hypothetical protein DPEC_G00173150 [Dallia pectoralis]